MVPITDLRLTSNINPVDGGNTENSLHIVGKQETITAVVTDKVVAAMRSYIPDRG
ncbi:hypothetical protein JCM31271_28420 [Halorubrum trueperi]|jgi:hypothetical protein